MKILEPIVNKATQWVMDNWRVLVTPACWLQSKPYSAVWDEALLKLMEKEEFIVEDKYTAKIGPVRVWIANHPYGSFTPYEKRPFDLRPSRKTILKAMDILANDWQAQLKKASKKEKEATKGL